MLSTDQVRRFKEDGFLLLKNVFTSDEIARFRAAGDGLPRNTTLSSLPTLEALWADPRFIGIAKQLLGEPVTYFGESSYLHEVFAPGPRLKGRHLHHDAKGTVENPFNRLHEPPPEPYAIIRFAIYLQDHATQSGGLKIVPGSHLIPSATIDQARLAYLDVPTEPGDLVVFCNRIFHSPYALRLKDSPQRAISPLEEVKLAAETPDAFLPGPLDRRVIFLDFAGHTELADIYIKGRALNPNAAPSGLVAAAAHIAEQARQAGVMVRMDSGLIEAMNAMESSATNGKLSAAGKPFLAALPLLCRLSQPWTDRFSFAPPPGDDSPQSAIASYTHIGARLKQLHSFWMTKQNDVHMGAYEVATPLPPRHVPSHASEDALTKPIASASI